MTTAQRILARTQSMRSNREPLVSIWRQCFAYTFPLRGGSWYSETETGRNGDQVNLNDSTTTEAARIFASHLQEGMTPSNALWFGLYVPEQSHEEQRWLDNAARRLWEMIHHSNFDAVSFESMLDLTAAGWPVMYCDSTERGGFHFEQWPMAQCSIAASRPGQPVDTIAREFEYTAAQAMSVYGERCSEKIRACLEAGKTAEKFRFIHYIGPRKDGRADAKMAKHLPFESVHIECTTKNVVRESGYHEFPCIVPRWQLLPGSDYAVGPVYEAMADTATLNRIKELEFLNLDIAVGGMWIAEDDGVLNPRAVKIGGRRVIIANSVNSMKELKSGADFSVSFSSEDRLQAQIRKLLMADILPPLEGQPRTAAEIHMRMAYIRKMLGPNYARVQYEYLQKLIERCFGMALRSGALGEAPQSLAGRSWFIKYKNPLARAQQLSEIEAIDNYTQGLAMLAEVDAGIMDNIDLDKAARYRGEALGVPWELIPDEKAIREKRLARQQAQQAAQQEQLQTELMQQAGGAAIQQMAAGNG